jgi:hypothetical protein
MCRTCHHPRHFHLLGFGKCNHPIGTIWLCGCLHYENGDQ